MNFNSIQFNWNLFFYLSSNGSHSISIARSPPHSFAISLSLSLSVSVNVSFPILHPSFKSEFYLHRFYRCHIALRLDFSLKFNWLSLNCYTFYSFCIPSHFGTTYIFHPSNWGTLNSLNFHIRCFMSRFIRNISNTHANDKSTTITTINLYHFINNRPTLHIWRVYYKFKWWYIISLQLYCPN